MPFNNPILGGNFLVRPAIQSPNYVPGVSGWSINKDGTVEFSSGTYRGSIEVGPLTGQHFIVNNSATGDPLDIYDSSNNLIFSINRFGVATSHNPASGLESSLQSGQIQIDNSPGLTNANMVLLPASDTHHQGSLEIYMSPPVGATYTLNLTGGSDDGVLGATLVGNERNVQGSMVQSDQRSINNLFHAASYSGTTNATGHVVVNHGCSFTPKGGVVIGTTPGATFANLTCGLNSLTATQADVNWTVANTGAAFASSGITFDMVLWG